MRDLRIEKYAEIKQGVYWVGKLEHKGMLHCNPYLIVDGDEGVLIDPGSPLDFAEVRENISSIMPIENLKYVVLQHENPDICASVPMFEELGIRFKIVCHRWTQSLVKYYGVKSEYYIVNDENFKLGLESGRELFFLETPYLHSTGSIVTYDRSLKLLFSGDLFGAYSTKWELYADDAYLEKMLDYHEYFMPSHDILKPSIEMMETIEIDLIAPQHGSIVNKDIPRYLESLKELECGAYLTTIKRKRAQSEGYRNIANDIIKRLRAIYSYEEVYDVVESLNVKFDPTIGKIKSHGYTDNNLLDVFFDKVYSKKGIEWLSIVEPDIRKLTLEYDIQMPVVYDLSLKKAELQVADFTKNIKKLKHENEYLHSVVKETEEKMMRDPVTHLYNMNYFNNYMVTEIEHIFRSSSEEDLGLISISIDNLAKIKYLYGDFEVDEVLKNTSYILQGITHDKIMRFRLQGSTFAVVVRNLNKKQTVALAEKIRNKVSVFEGYIESITVSMGVVTFGELFDIEELPEKIASRMYEVAMARLGIAKNAGMNVVCSESDVTENDVKIGKVLLVDNDRANAEFLKGYLEFNGFKVFKADNGLDAYDYVQSEKPDVIISDVMLPKMDGFTLREKLIDDSLTKNSLFIFLSHLKDEDSVKRSLSLNVDFYFKKPFMIAELIGIIKNRMKGVAFK